MAEAANRFVDLAYQSSFDAVGPLRVLAAYRKDGRAKPLMVCMHSYSGDRRQMQNCLAARAGKGLFAIAPDMRGRAESAGSRDDGGLEIADIHDAIQCALREFPDEIDAGNINIVGWSGGGGNVFQAVVKMPETFRSAQAFYGISDYGYLAHSSQNWMKQISAAVGGTPEERPERYLIRNAVNAIGNNSVTFFQIFWDEEETLCPKEMNTAYIDQAVKLELDNIVGRPSKIGDRGRWIHGAEINGEIAENMYEPQILDDKFPPVSLPASGTLLVPGFLITNRFTVCIGAGTAGMAKVSYASDQRKLRLLFSDAVLESEMLIWARFPLNTRGLPKVIWLNSVAHPGVIRRSDDPSHFYIYNIPANAELVLEWDPSK